MASNFGKRGAPSAAESKARESRSESDQSNLPRMSSSHAVGVVVLCAMAIGGLVAGWKRVSEQAEARRDYANAMNDVRSIQSNIKFDTGSARKVAAIEISHDAPAYPSLNIITVCREKWPRDFHMRRVCEDDQRNSKEAAEQGDFSTEVRVICAGKWPEDWHMYLVCARDQAVAQMPADQRPAEPTGKISDYCRREWGSNYSMREHCEESQEEAKREIKGRNIDDEIAVRCAADWPNNWQMFKHCVDTQSVAKSRL